MWVIATSKLTPKPPFFYAQTMLHLLLVIHWVNLRHCGGCRNQEARRSPQPSTSVTCCAQLLHSAAGPWVNKGVGGVVEEMGLARVATTWWEGRGRRSMTSTAIATTATAAGNSTRCTPMLR